MNSMSSGLRSLSLFSLLGTVRTPDPSARRVKRSPTLREGPLVPSSFLRLKVPPLSLLTSAAPFSATMTDVPASSVSDRWITSREGTPSKAIFSHSPTCCSHCCSPEKLKALAVALVGPELRPVAITTPSVARNRAFEDGSAATVSPVVVLRRCGTLVKSSEVSFW